MPPSKRHRGGKPPPKGTGRPSGKDRSAHEAARGKKIVTLSDLSRELPSESELLQIFQSLETESDRGCALIAGSLLENTLAMTINCYLANCGTAFRKKMHEGSDAPLGTFSAKIKMGRALAIYDAQIQRSFERVKDIRNAFAHALRPLDFTHPTITKEVRLLISGKMPKEEGKLSPARIRYSAFCWGMGRNLFGVATQQGDKELTIGLSMSDFQHLEQMK